MEIRKITTGFVTQAWDQNGNFLRQDFTCGDDCVYEDEVGESLDDDEFDEPGYEPYNMVQPDCVLIEKEKLKTLLDQITVVNLNSAAALDKLRDYLQE
jgi:hypothetical protein